MDSNTTTWNEYDPSLVKAEGANALRVVIRGSGEQGDPSSLYCVVTGTLGHPEITDFLYTN